MRQLGPRLLGTLVLMVGCALVLGACGSSGDSGASELVRQRELAEARKQAAEDARQGARIEQLERRLRDVNRDSATTATPTTTYAPPSPPERPEAVGDWAGGPGYTAILASLSSEAEAKSIQAEATARGLDAGILFSTDFSSLRPGYWVVFSGAFDGVDEAAARVSRAQGLGYTDAYPRFVAP